MKFLKSLWMLLTYHCPEFEPFPKGWAGGDTCYLCGFHRMFHPVKSRKWLVKFGQQWAREVAVNPNHPLREDSVLEWKKDWKGW